MKPCCKMLAVLLTGLAVAGAAQAQTTLRYKYRAGEKLEYVIDQDQKMSMSVGGQDIEMKVTMVIDIDWLTESVDEQGNAKVKVKVGRVKMNLDGPTGKVEADSKEPKEADDPLGQIFGQVVKAIGGMEMTFTVDPLGEVKDSKVSDEAVKKLKSLPGVDKLGDLISGDNMKSMMQGNMVLPKEAVEKGKSWKHKTDQKMPFGKITGETKYTYDGEVDKDGKKLEKIAVNPEIKIEPDPNAPIQIKVKDSKGKGYAYFDARAGRVVESNNETTMQMELEVAGMTIDQRIVQSTTMRLKKKD